MATKMMIKQHAIPSEDMKENLELVSIDSIKLWEGNTKKHTDSSVKRIAKLIETYGQQSPVVVWKKDRQIRKGNGTYLAITKILNRKTIYVKWADFSNKAEADLYAVSDNKSTEWSENDDDALRELFTREDIIEFTGKNKQRLKEFSGFTEEDLKELFIEKDLKKINDENGMCTVKIECRKDESEEIKSVLSQWAINSGFEGLIIH